MKSYPKLLQNLGYIGVFLTLSCPLSCSYCLNQAGRLKIKRQEIEAKQWIDFFNSLTLPSNLPLTFQGGEPSSYKGFWELLQGIKNELKIDLLTNLEFDLGLFTKFAKREHFTREAPYASIRVSFHPENMSWSETLTKVQILQKEGFRIGLYLVNHPRHQQDILKWQEDALKNEVDFRLKDFLGEYQGKRYGNYKYNQQMVKELVECKASELLLSPEGSIYRCHRDLYADEHALAQISTLKDFSLAEFRSCLNYGQCHPCDIKIKTNRFQEFGHTSVEIREKV